jgi:DNA-binding transcriptional LysR family regulator
MIEAEPEDAREPLRSGEIDLALVYDFESLPGMLDDELELAHLIDDPYEAILPVGHRLAERRTVKLADLADEPWVASTSISGCRRITERVCQEAGFEPRIAFEADETLAAQSLVAAGVGVSLLPHLALSAVHPGVVARSLGRAAPIRRIWAARQKGAYRSPASEAMVQILCDVAEEFRGADLAAA